MSSSKLTGTPWNKSDSPIAGIRAGRAYLILLALLLSSCGKKNAGPAPRYVIVSFENLSGDMSLDWVGRGTSEYLSRSLEGANARAAAAVADPGSGSLTFVSAETLDRNTAAMGGRTVTVPGVSASRDTAVKLGVNRIVAGYADRTAQGFRVTAFEEDAATHRILRTVSDNGASPTEALAALSTHLFSKTGPQLTTNAEAFQLYCLALSGNATDAIQSLDRAVALDPGFGRAWAKLAQAYSATGNRDKAMAVVNQARQQRLTPLDQVRLNADEAALKGDRAGLLEATAKAYDLNRGDAGFGQSLAEAETAAGNFPAAAIIWNKLAADSPDDANAWNQLGYTLAWSGNYTGALAAHQRYAVLRPSDANPFDSQGDVHYWFGKYSAAAGSYAAAQKKDPAFINGGELYKQAWATFLAGNTADADALFAQFRTAREKAKDPSIDLFAGDWLYRTGRVKEAVALLRDAAKKISASQPPAIRAGIAAQLAVWDLLAGDRPSAARDAAEGGTTNLTPGDFLVRFATLPSAAPTEWTTRAERTFAGPQLEKLRQTALGYALILDGKTQAAIPVWEDIAKQSAGTDFVSRTVLAHLKGATVEHMAPPDPSSVNPFASVLVR